MNDNRKDIAIIDRILLGDHSAYRELINRHKDYAFTVSYQILNNRENAEEVAQDAFMQAFKHLQSFNREAKFTTWFYRILFNASVGYKRKNKIVSEDLEKVPVGLQTFDTTDEIRLNEQQRHIKMAMQHLSPDDVTMITLFYLQELSLEEISEITGISADTAKVKLFRARKRLADELKKQLKDEVNSLL